MPGIIVSDTSCLILLEKLGKTDLLNSLFGTIIVTQIVANEYGGDLPEFVGIENPVNIVLILPSLSFYSYRNL